MRYVWTSWVVLSKLMWRDRSGEYTSWMRCLGPGHNRSRIAGLITRVFQRSLKYMCRYSMRALPIPSPVPKRHSQLLAVLLTRHAYLTLHLTGRTRSSRLSSLDWFHRDSLLLPWQPFHSPLTSWEMTPSENLCGQLGGESISHDVHKPIQVIKQKKSR